MVGKTKPPTKAERERMDRISRMKCIDCEFDNHCQPNATEVDHLVTNGYRRLSGGHMSTVPRCSYHHRGVPYSSPARGTMKADEMLELWGPSKALHRRKHKERYGTDEEVLARVNRKLGVTNG